MLCCSLCSSAWNHHGHSAAGRGRRPPAGNGGTLAQVGRMNGILLLTFVNQWSFPHCLWYWNWVQSISIIAIDNNWLVALSCMSASPLYLLNGMKKLLLSLYLCFIFLCLFFVYIYIYQISLFLIPTHPPPKKEEKKKKKKRLSTSEFNFFLRVHLLFCCVPTFSLACLLVCCSFVHLCVVHLLFTAKWCWTSAMWKSHRCAHRRCLTWSLNRLKPVRVNQPSSWWRWEATHVPVSAGGSTAVWLSA